jgi:act minimal PKS acyl carrier protein
MNSNITVDGMRRLIIGCAGAPEVPVADADFADTAFEQLGYESLALMESAAAIERDYGVSLADEVLFAAKTPRELTAVVLSARESERMQEAQA